MHFLVFQCSLYIIIDLNSLLNHWLRLKRRVVSERPSERVLARYRGEGRSGVEFFTNATQQKDYTIVILCSLPCLTSLR